MQKNKGYYSGQLYVAASRVGKPEKLSFWIKNDDNGLTRNVVFSEVLINQVVS